MNEASKESPLKIPDAEDLSPATVVPLDTATTEHGVKEGDTSTERKPLTESDHSPRHADATGTISSTAVKWKKREEAEGIDNKNSNPTSNSTGISSNSKSESTGDTNTSVKEPRREKLVLI